jgi:surface antigen
MRRPPIDLPRFLTGLTLAASLAAAAAAAPPREPSRPRAPAAAAAPADNEDDAGPALTACERRAQGRLRVWDRLGDAAISATRGIGRFVGASEESVAHVLRFGHSLSEGVQRRLNCHEQQQAEVATARAINGGVGTTSRWRSDTRANVSGSSTVVAQDRTAEGACLTVTDVIIVDGEETRAPKRMCRRPPSNRYVRV